MFGTESSGPRLSHSGGSHSGVARTTARHRRDKPRRDTPQCIADRVCNSGQPHAGRALQTGAMSDISHVLRTVDDLAKRVQALEEENKQLKRQLRPSTAGAAYPDREGTDGDGRQLPYLGGLPGDPVALEAIESELRYLAKRLDNNAAEDEKAKQLQETRDEQQDELIKMEFLKIKREVEKCAQSSDVRKVKNTLTEKLDELLEDASLIARQQCELSTENFQQDITSLSKISEKSMHAVDTLEARCVELESKLADYDVRHSDLASASSKLAMEQKRIDEKARKALRGSFELESKSLVASKDVLARVSVLEARLDDAFPPHRRRRRRTGVDGTDIWTGSTDSLEDLAMDYASLRDVELLKRALVSRLSETEDKQEKSIKSMRRARELDQEVPRHAQGGPGCPEQDSKRAGRPRVSKRTHGGHLDRLEGPPAGPGPLSHAMPPPSAKRYRS